jgi:hypothetical protein
MNNIVATLQVRHELSGLAPMRLEHPFKKRLTILIDGSPRVARTVDLHKDFTDEESVPELRHFLFNCLVYIVPNLIQPNRIADDIEWASRSVIRIH